MNKAGKFLVAVAAVGVIGTGVAACDTQPSGVQYVYVYQNGYYDSHHHYHTYAHPRKVKVTKNYYTSHKSQYGKPYKTVTVTPPKSVNKGTGSKVGGGSSYRKSGGSSYKKSGGFSSGRRR